MRVAALATLLLTACAHAQQGNFSFALIGDLGYWPNEEVMVDRVFAALATERLAFVVHDGDLGRPSNGSCTNEHWSRRLAQFEASPQPLVYTPGDNEWTDCNAADGAPGFEPLERLRSLRSRFFSTERSFGRQSIALTRQAGYPENARWALGGVTFVTLHVVGSNNGRGRTPEGDAEYAARTAADIAWMREGFSAAQAAKHRAVMIIQQGNIFPDFPPFPGGGPKEPSGYTEIREALEKEVVAFARPVVLVHGDSHFFRIDKPLGYRRGRAPAQIENFTRVETFGSPNHHWVQVFVSADDPNVFTFRPRLVEGNVQRRSP